MNTEDNSSGDPEFRTIPAQCVKMGDEYVFFILAQPSGFG
jgi:hypothetical protein